MENDDVGIVLSDRKDGKGKNGRRKEEERTWRKGENDRPTDAMGGEFGDQMNGDHRLGENERRLRRLVVGRAGE